MDVRSFQLADYQPVTELLETVLSEECYEQTMEAFARQLSWDSELVLVAAVNDEIAGIMIGTIDKGSGYYYRIAVHPKYQRQGIGKQLIASLRQRFTQRNVTKIMITADEHNEPILSLYESLGYVASDFFRSFQKLSIVTGNLPGPVYLTDAFTQGTSISAVIAFGDRICFSYTYRKDYASYME